MRKGRKIAKHCLFPIICGSGGSKSRLAKVAGAEPAGQRREEKLHAVVARSTFPSKNIQNIPFSDHFQKLKCQKSTRRYSAKYISKSKYTKHLMSGPFLKITMSKKYTPLQYKVPFQVKIYIRVRTFFQRLKCRFASLHNTTLHSTTTTQLHPTTPHYTPHTKLYYTTLH